MINNKEFRINNSNNSSLDLRYIYFSNITIRNSLKKYFKTLDKKKGVENLNESLNQINRVEICPTNEICELIKPKYFNNKNNDFSCLFSRYQNLVNKNKVNQSNFSFCSKSINMVINNSSLSSEDEKNNFITKSYYPNNSNYNFFSSFINNNHMVGQKQRKKRANNSINIDTNSKKKIKNINNDKTNKSMINSKNNPENKENFRYVFSSKEIPKNKNNNYKYKTSSKTFYSFSKIFKRSKINNKNGNKNKNYLNIVNLLNDKIKFPKIKLKPKTIFDIYEENKHLFKNKNQILKILKNNK